ncbi:DinB family protein [Muricauda sp. CAU 1633]|uniref:DinB family protein n=1 Tax=Allomuricauda sp. CAU 1633 TaxID=2816036 RepID=UPI001A8D9F92|nr:DinB family protein [Muricauda sp. CAU 1633]MBO0321194.1 DinB family protein [Muricauda sp. CAU 1633]
MEKIFDILLKNRKLLHDILQQTPKEELYKIPEGYNNNIWWNIAHVVVTPQLLVYGLCGLDYTIEEELINTYRKGTFPDGEPSAQELEKISAYLFSTVKHIQLDYEHGRLNVKNYKELTTSVNVTLTSAEDAIAFSAFHEGIHLGAIRGLQKALENAR